jgi:dolichol-phosphate mannosyltransferase
MRPLLFTATYNELDNVSTLVAECLTALPTSDMLVVDDGSPDGTGVLLENMKERWGDRLQVIHRPRKLGLGTAHKLAIKYAIAKGYDALITMDADYSHHPKYLPRMMQELQEAEFVTASRYVKGGKCDYDWKRQLLSRMANHLARTLLGIKLHETTTSYRGFSRRLLLKFPVDRIKAEGYAFFFESIFHATRVAQSVAEFPIHFEDRRAGTSKISKREIYRSFVRLARLGARRFLRQFKNYEPIPVPANAEACDVCRETLHVQLYAATARNHEAAMYNCTSAHHASHGRIVQCLVCGLVATNPKLSESELSDLYSDVVDHTYVNNIPARVATFEYNLNRVKNFFPPKAKMLDVGSYYGVFLNVARKHGYSVTGVEPSRAASNYAREQYNLDIYTGTLQSASASSETFDVVTSWDVMEHFHSPMSEIFEINRRLKLGGVFSFCTLNWDNWYAKLLGERWPWMMDMHLYYFDDRVIQDMLRRAGFEMKMMDNYCHIIALDYLFLKLNSLGVPGMTILKKILVNTPLAKIQVPFRFGDIRMYVAIKVEDADMTQRRLLTNDRRGVQSGHGSKFSMDLEFV